MSMGKSVFITTIFMALLGAVIYCFWQYSIRSYYVAVQMIAIYGFVRGWIDLTHWMAKAPTASDPYWDGENHE